MDEQTDEGLNLSREERTFVPGDMGQPHLHTSEGVIGVRIPQHGMIPPINDLILRPTHTDNDDLAGADEGPSSPAIQQPPHHHNIPSQTALCYWCN